MTVVIPYVLSSISNNHVLGMLWITQSHLIKPNLKTLDIKSQT